ncbi:MAG: heavy metal translocating P-type ATPase [Beijerinckiaceae bacterium]
MTTAVDLSSFVRHHDDGISAIDLVVDGITCAACIGEIEGVLKKLPGLARARVNYTTHRLTVEWKDGRLEPARMIEDLARIGYRAYPFTANEAEDLAARQSRHLLRCLAVAGFAAMNIMLLSVAVWAGNASDITPETRDFFHWLSALVVLPAAAFAGQPFFRSALRAIRNRSLNMDVPIAIGILLALAMSVVETARHAEHAYFDSAIMLIFFLLIGRYFDSAMRRKTHSFAANLAALRAPTATRIDAAGCAEVIPAAALSVGDRILVRPGERVPADGVVRSGRSELDMSLVSGETSPATAEPGTIVYAGTLNYSGVLHIEVTAAAANSLLTEILRLMDEAVSVKSRYLRLADRAGRLYAPMVHLTAAVTAVGWIVAGASLHDALVTAIAVLIITCPCALALAVPVVQVVAAGALFKSGILLNAGDAIERLAEVDTIVFDKTGTLTLPEPALVDADAIDSPLLQRAACLARASHHPLARALAKHAVSEAPPADAEEVTGAGVKAVIDGQDARLGSPAFCGLEADAEPADCDSEASTLIFRHGGAIVRFQIRQTLRSDAIAIIRRLAEKGYTLKILSGDRPAAVAAAAKALAISDWQGGLKPADKIAALEALKAQGGKVLMVGDGLNDAPALAAAHVSLAPMTAADLAQAASDATFLGERLAPVAEALTISRKARALMRENLGLAVIYNMIAVPLAISGHVTPLIAACAMSGSSILVTANAMRARHAAARSADAAADKLKSMPNSANSDRIESPNRQKYATIQ